jgi:HEPN domain-containing protein
MQEPVTKYIEAADDDLKAAAVLLENRQPFYVSFLCHQALQKILRGYSLETLNRYPPLINDLLEIADDTEAGLRMEDETRAFVDSLSVYPDVIGNPVYRKKIIDENTLDRAKEVLAKTQEVVEMVRALFT